MISVNWIYKEDKSNQEIRYYVMSDNELGQIQAKYFSLFGR